MDRKWKITLVGLLAIGLALTGCVDDDPSVVMYGSIVGSGSVDVDDDGQTIISCEFPLEFDEPEIWTAGTVNLADLQQFGQPVVAGSNLGGLANTYTFQAIMENRLFDSRTVGAVSGGAGGGYEGMALDKNDITIESVTVSFTTENNTFNVAGGTAAFEGYESERLRSILVQSGGGLATLDVPIIATANERAMFNEFIGTTLGQGDDIMVTFVAEIQLLGRTLGGTMVESNIYRFPIQMCRDCDMGTNPRCTSD